MSKEVQSREKTINSLYLINEAISREEYDERTLGEIVHCIKNIRILSLNIVNHLMKIRELSSYNVLGGKIDLEKINKVYLFDRNYFIKMKYDLDFLKNSKLAYFYEIEFEESDPFLILVNFKSEENSKKYFLKVADDMLNTLKQSQFLILQDLIFYHIFNINLNKNENWNNMSPKNRNNISNILYNLFNLKTTQILKNMLEK